MGIPSGGAAREPGWFTDSPAVPPGRLRCATHHGAVPPCAFRAREPQGPVRFPGRCGVRRRPNRVNRLVRHGPGSAATAAAGPDHGPGRPKDHTPGTPRAVPGRAWCQRGSAGSRGRAGGCGGSRSRKRSVRAEAMALCGDRSEVSTACASGPRRTVIVVVRGSEPPRARRKSAAHAARATSRASTSGSSRSERGVQSRAGYRPCPVLPASRCGRPSAGPAAGRVLKVVGR